MLSSGSGSESPASRDLEGRLADSDETSPLLRTNRHDPARVVPWLSTRSSLSAFLEKNAGLLLVTASQFFFSAMNISVKWLNSLDKPVPTLEAITYVCCIVYMCASLVMWPTSVFLIIIRYWRKIPDPILGPKDVRRLLVLRGFTGFVGLFGLYSSLQYLSLSDATVLTFIAPILTGFSGSIFLKEPLSLKGVFAGLCSFFGVVLIARPQFIFGSPVDPSEAVLPEKRMLSVAASLLGVLGMTGAFKFAPFHPLLCIYRFTSTDTLLRAIGKQAHTLHSLTFFSSTSVVLSTIGMVVSKITPVILPGDILWLAVLFLIGILGFIAQILLVMGFQRETASRGALAVYTSIVFAVIFEFIVFHTTPPPLSIAGTTIILSSAIYTSVIPSHSYRP
ncbi:hypothetical protein BC827DRAFT_1131223 [Russula dissimulans]|nr:hypothetical protein BC827DRAFT_1131223 [Russula dissimulans]